MDKHKIVKTTDNMVREEKMITAENISQIIPDCDVLMTEAEFMDSVKFNNNSVDFSEVLNDLCPEDEITEESKKLAEEWWGN